MQTGCLFNLQEDPQEVRSLAVQHAPLFAEMLSKVDELQATVFSPVRGDADPDACRRAEGPNGGYWGPWINVSTTSPLLPR